MQLGSEIPIARADGRGCTMIPSDQELLFTLFVPAGRPLPLPVLHGIAVEGQNAGHFFAFLPRLWVFALPLDL